MSTNFIVSLCAAGLLVAVVAFTEFSPAPRVTSVEPGSHQRSGIVKLADSAAATVEKKRYRAAEKESSLQLAVVENDAGKRRVSKTTKTRLASQGELPDADTGIDDDEDKHKKGLDNKSGGSRSIIISKEEEVSLGLKLPPRKRGREVSQSSEGLVVAESESLPKSDNLHRGGRRKVPRLYSEDRNTQKKKFSRPVFPVEARRDSMMVNHRIKEPKQQRIEETVFYKRTSVPLRGGGGVRTIGQSLSFYDNEGGEEAQGAAGRNGERNPLCPTDEAKVFFFGHSHVNWLVIAYCNHMGFKRERTKDHRYRGCPSGMTLFDPYLEYGGVNLTEPDAGVEYHEYLKMISYDSEGTFNRLVISSWAWDNLFSNNHPDLVRDRMLVAMKNLIPSFANSTTIKNQMIVMLPHFHQKPTFVNRIPCQDNTRMERYRAAIEAASRQFQRYLEEIGLADEISILMLDLWEWSKALGPGLSNFDVDGAHFQGPRQDEIIRGLFQKGFLCHANVHNLPGPPPNLMKTDFLRKVVEDADSTYARETFDWPDVPTCMVTRADTIHWFFWPNIRVRADGFNLGSDTAAEARLRWDNFTRPSMIKFYMETPFPSNELARHHMITALMFEPMTPFWAQECANNLGFGDGASWHDGSGFSEMLQPNVEYIFSRLAVPKPAAGATASIVARNRMLRSSGGRQQSTAASPSAGYTVPICTCLNSTHLFPEIHDRFIAQMKVPEEKVAERCGEWFEHQERYLAQLGQAPPESPWKFTGDFSYGAGQE